LNVRSLTELRACLRAPTLAAGSAESITRYARGVAKPQRMQSRSVQVFCMGTKYPADGTQEPNAARDGFGRSVTPGKLRVTRAIGVR